MSFNPPAVEGRCDACEGEGQVRVEMQFLADVFVPCDVCDGTRFRPQVLEVAFRPIGGDPLQKLPRVGLGIRAAPLAAEIHLAQAQDGFDGKVLRARIEIGLQILIGRSRQ